MKNKNSINKKEKSNWGIDWTKTGIASIAASVALSLGLTFGTATQENKNYNWDNLFGHNLKGMLSTDPKFEWWKPFPIFTWRLVITNNEKPYVVKDSVKIYYDVDEHFTLDTKIINSKWYEDLQDIIRDAATQKDTSAVVWFDFAKKWVEPNTHSKSMTIDSVTWHASPEAIKYEWSSLKIWNVEQENIKTAEKRAEIWYDALKSVIREISEQNPDLDIESSSINVSWDEIQLNEEELKTLEDLANFEGYSSVESMIYANERWEITSKSVSETINKIINTKRNVIITFTKKWTPDTIYVVPLVLLPIIILKRKKSENDESDDSSNGTEWGASETTTDGWESDGGETEVYPPFTITPKFIDWDNWWEGRNWGKWGNGGNWGHGGNWGNGGGWGTIIPPIYIRRRKKRKYEEVVPNPKLDAPLPKYNPYNSAFQTKQPWDKREHYFRNERKWNFGRSRTWRTKKD